MLGVGGGAAVAAGEHLAAAFQRAGEEVGGARDRRGEQARGFELELHALGELGAYARGKYFGHGRDFTLSLHKHFDLDATRWIGMRRETADPRLRSEEHTSELQSLRQ